MTRFASCLASIVAFAGPAAPNDKPDASPLIRLIFGAPARPDDKPAADTTHQQVKEIAVKGEVSGNTLQTLCLDGNGNVVALVAPGRYGDKPGSPVSEVKVYSAGGERVRRWKVDFIGQSINAGPAADPPAAAGASAIGLGLLVRPLPGLRTNCTRPAESEAAIVNGVIL